MKLIEYSIIIPKAIDVWMGSAYNKYKKFLSNRQTEGERDMRWFKTKKEPIRTEERALVWGKEVDNIRLLREHVDMVQELVYVGSFSYDHEEKEGYFTKGVYHILGEDNK